MFIMDISEKKELILSSYKTSYDKEMSYKRNNVSPEERELLDNDEGFQIRLEHILSQEKERIINKLRGFMDCGDTKIAFQATTALGNILYPEFFKRMATPVNVKVSKELTDEEESRIAEEYGHLLGKKNVKKSIDRQTQ